MKCSLRFAEKIVVFKNLIKMVFISFVFIIIIFNNINIINKIIAIVFVD